MSVVRVEIQSIAGYQPKHSLVNKATNYLHIPLQAIEIVKAFWLLSHSGSIIPKSELHSWAGKVFCDPILEKIILCREDLILRKKPSFVVEVRFLPGVTDNVGHTATEALSIVSGFARRERLEAHSGHLYFLYGDLNFDQAQKIAEELLANVLLYEIKIYSYGQWQQLDRFIGQSIPKVSIGGHSAVELISLDKPDIELQNLSTDRCWALTVEELKVICKYFANPELQKKRIQEGLGKNPTDVELEILAQTWSEHCKHKIFQAEIAYQEKIPSGVNVHRIGKKQIQSVFSTYIKGITKKLQKSKSWLVSVFSDNAGIVRFDKKVDICIKVETHNSPSALDPYGGALTGIVGVNRDILGCGLGARPIANTDVFCFAPPDFSLSEIPVGLKHPRRIMEGVHLGVEDGGNKSGIPTVNGAIVFHRNFLGKPLVFCGTIGVLPHKTKRGIVTSQKGQKPGHHIVMAGGRIGKDGIHGATFSSMELTTGAPATAVQIGDPITQKRLSDFLLEARDLGLFSSVTDNGAGGLSSSVGEMAELTNGATIDVSLAPAKYVGLKPFELTVSESQERMTFAVPKEEWPAFLQLAKQRNVEVTDLGTFTDDGFFRILYQGKTVALLGLDFLHHGLPTMKLNATWEGPQLEKASTAITANKQFYEKALLTLLGSYNICSKEALVRRYDHEVQAATVVKPFVGNAGPGDAAVLWLAPHGGEANTGITIACGLVPRLSRFDTYIMAQHALDEAFRNAIAVGTDPKTIALVDNFCWPDPLPSKKNPDAEHKLAQLVRACEGLYDLANLYSAPFVSGKDSMKNDFIGKTFQGQEIKISVPPTVLVTALGKISNIKNSMTSDFKNENDEIFLIGDNVLNLAGSEFSEHFSGFASGLPPAVEGKKSFNLYQKIHQLLNKNVLNSCHDCSDGGMLLAICESMIGGNLGAKLVLDDIENLTAYFFNESPGRFIVSVSPKNRASFIKYCKGIAVNYLGKVIKQKELEITLDKKNILKLSLGALQKAWRSKL